MKHMYSAGIVTYIIQDNVIFYLLLHYTAGHWEFPKGTMEKGETKEDTAIRELEEETGLTAIIDEDFEESINYPFMTYDKEIVQKTVYFFTGRATSNKVKLSHEHSDYKWLPYKEALMQLTYANGKTLLKTAHKHIVSILKENI
jgi:bis(5'-nucleosidyl)-tetraphosphatase